MGFRAIALFLIVGAVIMVSPGDVRAQAMAADAPIAALTGVLSGVASYQEQVTLPANAVLEAVLEDVSLADAPAVEIGRVEDATPGNPPFAFAIPYDPARIDPKRSYAVRGRITAGDRVMFVSDGDHPVLTRGAPPTVDVPMHLARAPETPASEALSAIGPRLPAHFSGDLPCEDCDAVSYSLNLWPDQVFNLRRVWQGKKLTQDAIGRWSVDIDRKALILWDGEDKTEFIAVAPDRLRLAGQEGGPELVGAPGIAPMELRLPMRGMVTFLAEKAHVTDCLSGRDYPLTADGDFATLEAAYLASGVAQGTPLMASFEASVADRPRPDGRSDRSVRVERFTGVWPDETCERAMSSNSLTNTYWKILRLGKTEIGPSEDGREPHLVLKEGETRFVATIGCNQIVGGFTRDGDKLRFGQSASTMMACPPPLDAWEAQLIEALTATVSWRVNSQTLELLDATGMQVALFQAVALP